MSKGKLIVLEGCCDGIGKSTQYALLCKRLQGEGKSIVTHHFPSYGTYQGKPVEMYLQGSYGHPNDLSPYFVNSLYAVDRVITWNTELKDSFLQGKIVLLDRYTTSSLIYQAAVIEDIGARKNFIDYVCDFEYNRLGIKVPDDVIFLYAPFDVVTEIRNARRQNTGIENDIHESDLEFMEKVYDNSMFIADYLGWNKVECNLGNEMKSIGAIHKDVYRRVRKMITK